MRLFPAHLTLGCMSNLLAERKEIKYAQAVKTTSHINQGKGATLVLHRMSQLTNKKVQMRLMLAHLT